MLSSRPSSERRYRLEAESDGNSNGREAVLDAIARRCLARLLGHSPTRRDAAQLPGIDVSDL
jgi:hypothetical protein